MKLSRRKNNINTQPFFGQSAVNSQDTLYKQKYHLNSSTYINYYQGKWLVVRKAEIKHLVFSGGGAKGVIYPGVLKAFEQSGRDVSARDQIESVSGSSIGAITAAIFACGVRADDYMHALEQEDFAAILGPVWQPIRKSGAPLLAFLRHNLYQGIKCALAQRGDVYQLKAFQALNPNDRLLIDDLLQAFDHNRPAKITFAHLSALRRFDSKQFKSLAVTAVRRSNGDVMVFDDESTPQLEIAMACLASGALPLIVKPVKIEKRLLGELGEGYVEFVDGGYLDNIPVEIPDKRHSQTEGSLTGDHGQDLRTLVMVFESNSHPVKEGQQSPFLDADPYEEHVFFHSNLLTSFARNELLKNLAGINTPLENTEQEERGFRRVNREYAQRVIALNTQGVGIMSFGDAQKKTQSLFAMGQAQTQEYLELHRGELSYKHFDNLTALMLHLADEELNDIKKLDLDTSVSIEDITRFRQSFAEILRCEDNKTLVWACTELCSAMPNSNSDISAYFQYIGEQLTQQKRLNAVTDGMERGSPLSEYLMNVRKQAEILDEKKEIIAWLNTIKKKGFNGHNQQLLDTVREKVIKSTDFGQLQAAMKLMRDYYQHRYFNQQFINSLRSHPHTSDKAEKKLKQLVEKSIQFEPVVTSLITYKMGTM